MHAAGRSTSSTTSTQHPPPLPAEEIAEGQALLRWLADDHFTFLGYREYRLEDADDGDGRRRAARRARAPASASCAPTRTCPRRSASCPPRCAAKAREKTLLVLAKANSRGHRAPAGLPRLRRRQDVRRERRGRRRAPLPRAVLVAPPTPSRVTRIPVLREKADAGASTGPGSTPLSHAGKALMDVLETYPRDELFQTPVDELVPIAEAVMHTRERRQLRLFVRRDTYGRYLSCLVYLPRDRYNTAVRERIAGDPQGAARRRRRIEYTARVSESLLARLHFVVRPEPGEPIGDVRRRPTSSAGCAEAARSWRDDFVAAVHRGVRRGGRRRCWPAATPTRSPRPTRRTTRRGPARSTSAGSRSIAGDGGLDLSLYEPTRRRPGRGAAQDLPHRAAAVAVRGAADPVLDGRRGRRRAALRSSTGSSGESLHLRLRAALPPARCPTGAPRAVPGRRHRGLGRATTRVDGFNALVLAAGLTWRQATVLRAYAKYMRQGGTPFAQDYIEDALRSNVDITRLLVAAVRGALRPGPQRRPGRRRRGPAGASAPSSRSRIDRALDDVASLDHDRILRSYLTVIRATLRTNFFQPDADGGRQVLHLAQARARRDPRPARAAAEVRDLRLLAARRGRAPALRRGRPRRPALVRPPRRLPHRGPRPGQGADGEEHRDRAGRREGRLLLQAAARPGATATPWLAEGIACYKTFISGLLDITDNLVGGETVPPPRRGAPRRRRLLPGGRRRQGHRDVLRHRQRRRRRTTASGSATRSPPAARSATTTRRWASPPAAPGSRCAGTSARWASTARPRTSPASASATCPATCSATACCCSEHIRLVAAFDHRDIFLDPDPDAGHVVRRAQAAVRPAAVELAGLRHVA